MRGVILAGISVMAALAVAACERPSVVETEDEAQTAPQNSGAALAGFLHEQTVDLSGYYLPVTTIQAGNWRLHHIAMSDAPAFAAWEDGDRPETHGPIMLHFDDVSSPTGTNELGGEYHEVTARVLPTAYEIGDERARFRGRAPGVGSVTFDGALDADALESAQRELGGGEAVVLTGTLTVGDQVFEGQRFRWWMGD